MGAKKSLKNKPKLKYKYRNILTVRETMLIPVRHPPFDF